MLDKSTAATTAPPATVTRAESAVPRALQKYLSLDDFEPTARRRIPKFLYGYISGGAETDAAVRDNRKAFDEYGFVPRVLNDVSGRDQTTTLFGKSYASPFGIPPMGSSALCAYRGDIVLTRAAAETNVPMILSASSLITLEDVRRENNAAWYQAYLAGVAGAHRTAGRSRRGGRLRHLRRHRRRAGAAQPREQHPQRLSGAARDHAARVLGHDHASALAVRHLGAHREEFRHAAFREHGRQARPAGAREEPDAQYRPPRPARLEACRTDPQEAGRASSSSRDWSRRRMPGSRARAASTA